LSNFSDLGLSGPLLKALASEGYTHPTPIQAQAIPQVLTGRDLCGIAQTGTGKTAAFALPILDRLAKSPRPLLRKSCRTLVLSPTRELATQIADSFRAYGRHMRLSTAVVFGGTSVGKNERQVAGGVDILVATPGRLLDLVDRRALSLREVEILVLDEADQMLDLGFIHALKRIVKLLPAKRQSLFFSATMPKTIASLADEFLSDPAKVAVTPVATTVERVEQRVMFVPAAQKQALLAAVLRDPAIERVLVFTRTKHGADKVVRGLDREGIAAAAIHGNKSQPQRERALAAFRAGKSRVLVATDIAARGIDVDGVTHVINFELPNVPESYVHRIGRTARAGADGVALSFCNEEERAYLRDIERLTRLKVPVMPTPAGIAGLAPVAEAERRSAPEPRHRAAGRNRPQPAKAEAQRNGAGGKGRNRRRRRPHGEGAPAAAAAAVAPSQGSPAQGSSSQGLSNQGLSSQGLPSFIVSSAQERRSQGAAARGGHRR
jgi:ATP-dependent RNA helicase RhlE